MSKSMDLAARFSLSFLWIFTAFSSAYISKDIGYEILASGGVTGILATSSLYAGSVLDFIIGIWLLTGKQLKVCCQVQMGIIFLYTLLISVIDPSYWVHPFGPLTKNIPILALIYHLYREHELSLN